VVDNEGGSTWFGFGDCVGGWFWFRGVGVGFLCGVCVNVLCFGWVGLAGGGLVFVGGSWCGFSRWGIGLVLLMGFLARSGFVVGLVGVVVGPWGSGVR